MKISARAEYACLAVLELAARYETGEPVRIKTIAEEHAIPIRFLVQILLQLKGAGIVNSTRGAAGGYQLQKPPQKISLFEVMSVIVGNDAQLKTAVGDGSPTGKVLHDAWEEIARKERSALSALTYDKLVSRVKEQQELMYYI